MKDKDQAETQPQVQTQSIAEQLPEAVLEQIFQHLVDKSDIKEAQLVCKAWYTIVQREYSQSMYGRLLRFERKVDNQVTNAEVDIASLKKQTHLGVFYFAMIRPHMIFLIFLPIAIIFLIVKIKGLTDRICELSPPECDAVVSKLKYRVLRAGFLVPLCIVSVYCGYGLYNSDFRGSFISPEFRESGRSVFAKYTLFSDSASGQLTPHTFRTNPRQMVTYEAAESDLTRLHESLQALKSNLSVFVESARFRSLERVSVSSIEDEEFRDKLGEWITEWNQENESNTTNQIRMQ